MRGPKPVMGLVGYEKWKKAHEPEVSQGESKLTGVSFWIFQFQTNEPILPSILFPTPSSLQIYSFLIPASQNSKSFPVAFLAIRFEGKRDAVGEFASLSPPFIHSIYVFVQTCIVQ